MSISKEKIYKEDNEFEGKQKEYFTILYGSNYENTLEIRLSELSNEARLVHSLFSEIKLLNKDLEIPNSLGKFPRKKSKVEIGDAIYMNFILALDSCNNIHFYNLENLNIILHDMNLNSNIWKNILNQKIINSPKNYKHLLNNNLAYNDMVHSFETQTINSIFGPQEITHSYFYSFFDQENSKTYSLK